MTSGGSWLLFETGSNQTSIQETWGLNLLGGTTRPVKIFNSSLLVGYPSNGEEYGTGNALISGKVGIGTTSPTTSLHIASPNNQIQLRLSPVGGEGLSNSSPSIIDFFSTFDKFPADQGPRRTASIKGAFSGGAWGAEILSFHVGKNGANDIGSEPLERMRIDGNGNVSIGTTDPRGYKLAVNGSVIASSVTVKTYGNWPDYVFLPAYNLKPLKEVSAYIAKNGHLPEVPSQVDVAEMGINLGEMNKLLLKKIEELTLYLIEKDKQVEKLEQRLTAVEQLTKN